MLPKELVVYINLLTAECPMCRVEKRESVIARTGHLNVKHGADVPDIHQLVKELEKTIVRKNFTHNGKEIVKINRKATIAERAKIINIYIGRVKAILDMKKED